MRSAIVCSGSWRSSHACTVMFSAANSWIGGVTWEPNILLDEGIPSNVRELQGNLGCQVSTVTHRSGASVTFTDAFLNPDGGENTPWLLLLDLASMHRTTETRAQIPEHIKFAFNAAGAISFAQPLDRAIFRTWKHVVSKRGQSSNGCLAVGHGWSVELLRGPWSAAPEGPMRDEDTGCVRGGVCARRELRTKAWRLLEWSSNEELLECSGETPQLHC